jgi:putative ABC transport system permease protein
MNDEEIKLDDDGVILTKKLSKLINKKAGDIIEITINDKVIKAKISAVTEHYIQHYIYISPAYYKKITGSDITFNSFYGLLNNKSEVEENNTLNTLKEISSVNSIVFKNNIQVDYNKSINSINTVVVLLIASAGVLAFVVIYNLTNINISERRRELATIKLLGFYNSELATYIYRENMILTVLGGLTGIFVGIFLNKFITSTAETNIIMFLQKISPINFLYSILLTLLFSVVVNLFMYNRFDKIDMIESLKSTE